MAPSVADSNFAWYRLHAPERAALIVLLVLAGGLFGAGQLTRRAPAKAEVSRRPVAAAKVSVNSGGVSELAALPGIGPVKAEKIIAARKLTPLRSIDDLQRAAGGISQANLARMAPYVDFEK